MKEASEQKKIIRILNVVEKLIVKKIKRSIKKDGRNQILENLMERKKLKGFALGMWSKD